MRNNLTPWSPVPIRLILGLGFIYHGYVKLFTSVGQDNFLRLLNDIGVPAAGIFSWAIGGLEFLGGIALLLGSFMTITNILLLINMAVAMFWVNLPNGFDLMNVNIMIEAGPKFGVPGIEINLLYIACLISLLFTGAGNLSVDTFRKEKNSISTVNIDS